LQFKQTDIDALLKTKDEPRLYLNLRSSVWFGEMFFTEAF